MKQKPRLLFVHISPEYPSFIKQDMSILSKYFEVGEVLYRTRFDISKIVRGTLWADITLSWFVWDQAAWATRLSRLFGRKSVVVVGGFDVVKMPEISYGNLLNPHAAARTFFALRHADQVVAVSKSLKEDAERFCGRHDIKLVYHGFDVTRFSPADSKESIALTVGTVTRSNLKRKGIETFIKAAEYAPEIEFRLVGMIDSTIEHELKKYVPKNVTLVGQVDFKTLLEEMRRAKVYVQVSGHEGFGCSLAEAMLCASVPVVTSAGAIPEVVGDTGLYVPLWDPKSTAEAIKNAMLKKDGMHARERIMSMFPIEKREKELVATIRNLIM